MPKVRRSNSSAAPAAVISITGVSIPTIITTVSASIVRIIFSTAPAYILSVRIWNLRPSM
jgi:hypothetical protein